MPYVPTFRVVDDIASALARRRGGAMRYAEIEAAVGRRLDCPHLLMALLARPDIRINRKACSMRSVATVAPPGSRAREDAWMDGLREGVLARALCERGAETMKRKQREGRAVNVLDWAEGEHVWFPFAPRVPQLSSHVADLFAGIS